MSGHAAAESAGGNPGIILAMGDKNHVYCPACGYDLHGIPERRCPECGFGFDKAAALSVSIAEAQHAFAAARAVIAIAAMSVICAGAAVSGEGMLITVPVLVAIAVWILGRFAEPRPPRAFDLLPPALGLWVVFVVVTLLLFRFLPVASRLCAVIFAVCAWGVCLLRRVGYAYAELNLGADVRRELRLHSRTALALLLIASVLVIASLV